MRLSLKRLVCQTFAGVLFISPGAVSNAHADSILSAYVYADPGTGGENTTFGTETGPGASVSASSNLSVSASGHSYSVNGIEDTGGGSINLYYYYEITGPGNVSVPLTITANLAASVSGTEAQATATLHYVTSFGVCADTTLSNCGSTPSSATLNASYSVPSNTVEENELSAYAAGFWTGPGSSATALVDPVITIDPTFLANNPGYSLVLSPNVSQGESTPEPGTFVLLLTGSWILFLFRAIRRWPRRLSTFGLSVLCVPQVPSTPKCSTGIFTGS